MSDDPALPQDQGSLTVDGRTNQAGVGRAKPQDMAVLCLIICSCLHDPLIGVAGQKLYQLCVSSKLRSLDWNHLSRYKPEVNYDTTQQPPAPIMDSGLATKAHDWLKGWIDKYWDEPGKDRPPFRPCAGLIRRPDVVTVIDPTRPPTQDNLEDVIEIKFPGDEMSVEQIRDYTAITGKEPVLLKSKECKCSKQEQPQENGVPVEIEQLAPLATMAAWLAFLASGGRTPLPAR
ncbi:VRR-NUC domain-containing protein [Xanthomonas oryzae]|uniref:VRR-NUC domain-containing protein n=1 Tax=Xanthomonas oryzae pv. oryzicola (strain BLS256) TaxID=383407 RepID=G7TH70_XANOB|nr:VRR-NUC domain-containing protein [Xanthomonas oryzae]AEQ95458.1 hypothetical protein XOC_1270 [Xanthomonas oryzae pv. oryzicola BLS256]AKO19042.1 hypothetical protein ACU11_05760 [Xanthomonas oryzae pv. oryzicola]PUE94459.1 VRR-NUC domain-containing protein [Xanthomonas oryzae pv. oryzicola]WVN05716.1 VRR-NUC domain-containing protein [Xanthomonas oryzae pv. oryzicola]